MKLSLIVDYFRTCESKDEILELVDGTRGGGRGVVSNSTFNLLLVMLNF
jgi:hypothetical protein